MPEPAGGGRLVLAAIGALGASAVMTQLALMREMLGAFAGNEMVLGILLGNWLLLSGVGAWLGRTDGRLRRPAGVLGGALVAVAVLPLAQVFVLRALRNVVFLRGAMVGVTATVAGSLVLLAPYCVLSGYLLTLGCSIVGRGGSASGAGRVYVADSLGSIVGGALFSFVLVRLGDHLGILCAAAVPCLVLGVLVALRAGRGAVVGAAALAAAAGVGAVWVLDADGFSTALQYPRQRVVFRASSPYGKLVVTESAGQYNFVENGVPLFSTHDLGRVEETVHYAMIQRPDARRVLLVSGGVSGTAQEILKYGVAEVTYVELNPLVVEAGRRLLPDNLADPRIRVVTTDGRLFIKRARDRYDVVIVDVADPTTSRLNRFHTAEFFGEVGRVLEPGGVLAFGLGRYENYVSPALARMLASARRTLEPAFRNVLLIPGGRVFFLASDGELHADIGARIERLGVATRLVQRNYLEAMLAPDRMGDLRRAVAQPAAVNTDFSPVLYYYHLLHWIGQFKVSFGVLEGALLALFAVYLLRMRAVPLAIFVSGFAASALQVVLLLGLQILHGSLYQHVGVIVTTFMAGLAAGAWLANRPGARAGRGALARLAFAVAAFAAALPPVLMGLARAGGGVPVAPWAVPLLAFVLAGLVGMEFPVACRVEGGTAAATASRLYAADFTGAFLGALLPSTWLIPLLGVTSVCLLTAGLSVLGGIAVVLRRR